MKILKYTWVLYLAMVWVQCSHYIGTRQSGLTGRDQVANIMSSIKGPVFPDYTIRITDFSAIGDGLTDCKPAFDQAITDINHKGGGTLLVPAGTFLLNGPLVLKSNVRLHLDDGATLKFSGEPGDYLPVVLSRRSGIELYNYAPMVYASHAVNIAITGAGTLDGSANRVFAGWHDIQNDDQALLMQMNQENIPVNERIFGRDHHLRPDLVGLWSCSYVRIDSVTLVNAPCAVVHATYCDNVQIRNVNISSENPDNKALVVDASRNVLIEQSSLNTRGSGIAIEAGYGSDGDRVGRPAENILIRQCFFQSADNGLLIGSETVAGVRNVFMEHCRMDSVGNAVTTQSAPDRGGWVENINVSDLAVMYSRHAVINLNTLSPEGRTGLYIPAFKRLIFQDIDCEQAGEFGLYIKGDARSRPEDVWFENVNITGTQTPVYHKFTKDLKFDRVNINGQLQAQTPPTTPDGLNRTD